MLIVTHEMGIAAYVADRIAFIDEARSSSRAHHGRCSTRAGNRGCGSSCRRIMIETAFEEVRVSVD